MIVEKLSRGWKLIVISLPVLTTGFLSNFVFQELRSDGIYRLALEEIIFVFVPLALLFAMTKWRLLTLNDVGLSSIGKHDAKDLFLYSVLVVFTISFLGFFISRILKALFSVAGISDWYTPLGSPATMSSTIVLFMFTVVYSAASTAVVEEVYFRGILFCAIKDIVPSRLGSILFVIVSGTAFGISHWWQGSARVAAMTIVGLSLAALYVWMKTLWPLIIGHFIDGFVRLYKASGTPGG